MTSAYAILKALHVGCAAASIAFFCVRGAWMFSAPERLRRKWVRVLPHVVDTVLLASAIALAIMLRNYPLTHGWLTAKVVGLFAYIALGTVALKRGRTRGIRAAAFAGAIVVFVYIVSVAVTKSPAGFLAWT
ncbi:MAG: SirB2 family protein [Betaproteobacteria bacterium]